jgi:hypothetical protein
MNTAKSILMTITMAALLTPAVQLKAERADDGIFASPKLREQLDFRKTIPSRNLDAPSRTVVVNDGIFASPKLREQMDSHFRVRAEATTLDLAHAKSSDGIVASPKLREQMGTRFPRIEVAPIK